MSSVPPRSASRFTRERWQVPRHSALGVVALLWFMAVIRRWLGDREDQFFATVFLGSGIAFGLLTITAAVCAAAPTLVVQFGGVANLDHSTVALAHGLWFGLWGVERVSSGRCVHRGDLHHWDALRCPAQLAVAAGGCDGHSPGRDWGIRRSARLSLWRVARGREPHAAVHPAQTRRTDTTTD